MRTPFRTIKWINSSSSGGVIIKDISWEFTRVSSNIKKYLTYNADGDGYILLWCEASQRLTVKNETIDYTPHTIQTYNNSDWRYKWIKVQKWNNNISFVFSASWYILTISYEILFELSN